MSVRAALGLLLLVSQPLSAQTSGSALRPASVRPAIAAEASAVPVLKEKPDQGSVERETSSWTDVLKFGAEYRGRVEEAPDSVAAGQGRNGYYLSRTRLDAAVNAGWFGAYAQVQDAQALGYGPDPQPASVSNPLDVRQAYIELRANPAFNLRLRAGRQELSVGNERLIGASNWGNTARTFDAVRWSASGEAVDVDAFFGSVVVITPGAFDRRRRDEVISGLDVDLKLLSDTHVTPYVILKHKSDPVGKSTGGSATYTFGARAAGPLPKRFDYDVELAFQRGHSNTAGIQAWAGHYALGWRPAVSRAPRVVAEVNHASGDHDPGDGRVSTFDQLYPTNHSKYGIADQIGWRNMREAMLGMALPAGKVTFRTDVHHFWLASSMDALYSAGGGLSLLNREATSRSVGTELDLQSTYALSNNLGIGAGVGMVWSGRYLLESGRSPRLLLPYVTWTVTF